MKTMLQEEWSVNQEKDPAIKARRDRKWDRSTFLFSFPLDQRWSSTLVHITLSILWFTKPVLLNPESVDSWSPQKSWMSPRAQLL